MVKLKKLRPRCFFDISIDGENAGRIIFELFNETCPKTCENFKALCTGESGIGRLTGKPLHYKNVNFHRIINGFMIQSGDFSQNNGKGGESIFGGTFNDESFEHKHDRPFLLSMANRGPNTNGSQFFITLVPTPHLDGVHVVFGHVIVGQDVVMRIAQQPVDKQSRPAVSVCISNCGELVPQIKPKPTKTWKAKKRSHKKRKNDSDDDSDDTSSDSSDSSSSSSSSSTSSSESEDSSQETTDQKQADNGDNTKAETENSISLFNPKYSVRIDPDEIPEVPQNRFLQRSFRPAPSTNETVIKNKDKEEPSRKSRSLESSSNNNRNDRSYERRILYTRSGRKIKGRGSVRYRTPTPDDDDDHRYRRSSYSSRRWRRSETPPYWRAEQSKLRPWKQIISDMDRAKKRDSEKDKSRQRSSRSRSNERHHRRHRHHHRENRNNEHDDHSNRNNDRHRSRSSSPTKYQDRKMDEKNGRHKRKFREFPSPPPSSVSEKRNSNSKHTQSRKSIEKENHPQDLQQNESNDINTANKLQKAIELKT